MQIRENNDFKMQSPQPNSNKRYETESISDVSHSLKKILPENNPMTSYPNLNNLQRKSSSHIKYETGRSETDLISKSQNDFRQTIEQAQAGNYDMNTKPSNVASENNSFLKMIESTLLENKLSQNKSSDNNQDKEKLFEVAKELAQKKQYQDAVLIYKKILEINPNCFTAWTAGGHCLILMNNPQAALQFYNRALSLSQKQEVFYYYCITPQNDYQLWYGAGQCYNMLKDFSGAEIAFKKVLDLNPSNEFRAEVLLALGMIHQELYDHRIAIKFITKAILLGTLSVEKIADALCQVGRSFEELAEYSEGIQTYNYVLMLNDTHPRALFCLANILFHQDKPKEALELLQRLRVAPNTTDLDLLYLKARCHLKVKEAAQAYEYLHKCISISPDSSIYWSSLGILFGEILQPKECHDCLIEAIRYGPEVPENYFNMGCLFEICGQPNDALTMYDQALKISPQFSLAIIRKKFIQAMDATQMLEVQFKHQNFVPNKYFTSNFLASKNGISLKANEGLSSNFQGNSFDQHISFDQIQQQLQQIHQLQQFNSMPSTSASLLMQNKPPIFAPSSDQYSDPHLFYRTEGNPSIDRINAFYSQVYPNPNSNPLLDLSYNLQLQSQGFSMDNYELGMISNKFKNTTSPIVLKHDPKAIYSEKPKEGLGNEENGFKKIHKMPDLHDASLKKKIKPDNQ